MKGFTMMYWGNNTMNGWGYALMGVSNVLFWGLLIAGIVFLARYLGDSRPRGSDRPPPRNPPEEVLAERFARGEIDDDEYRRRLAILRGQDVAQTKEPIDRQS